MKLRTDFAATAAIGLLVTCALPAPSLAQAVSAPAGEGALSYPASYFAAQNPVSAYDMVVRLPGFAFDGGAQVRGFAGAAGNVLIDGRRPSSKTDDLAGLLARVPASQVERIDLIRGGAPGIDMQGKSVVANVILKRGGGFHGDVRAAHDWTEAGRSVAQTEMQGVWRNGATVVEAGLLSDTLPDSVVGRGGPGPRLIVGPAGDTLSASTMQTRATHTQNRATAAFQTPLGGGVFRINLMLQDIQLPSRQRDDFQPALSGSGLAFAGVQTVRDVQDTTDAELGLHYTRDLNRRLSFELIGLQHLNAFHDKSDFVATGDLERFSLGDHGGESIARGVLHYLAGPGLTLDGGGEFAFNWVKSRTRFEENGLSVPLPAADVQVQERRGEAFARVSWRPNAQLGLEAALRVEASAITSSGDVALSNGFAYPKPRLTVTWSPDAKDQFRFRIEREVGQLDFTNFVGAASLNGSGVQTGNPNLTPQQDWALEATYERHFWTSGAIVLTARRLALADVIDRKPVGAFDAPGNIGRGAEYDYLLSFTLPLDRLFIPHGELRGVGTWRVSQVTDPATGQRRAISGQHSFDGEMHFTQDIPSLSVTWGIDSWPRWREQFFRLKEIDTYVNKTWNQVFIEYKPQRTLTLRFEADNVSRRPFLITRSVYGGARLAGAPPAYSDEQTHRFGMEFLFRVVKSFGT